MLGSFPHIPVPWLVLTLRAGGLRGFQFEHFQSRRRIEQHPHAAVVLADMKPVALPGRKDLYDLPAAGKGAIRRDRAELDVVVDGEYGHGNSPCVDCSLGKFRLHLRNDEQEKNQ